MTGWHLQYLSNLHHAYLWLCFNRLSMYWKQYSGFSNALQVVLLHPDCYTFKNIGVCKLLLQIICVANYLNHNCYYYYYHYFYGIIIISYTLCLWSLFFYFTKQSECTLYYKGKVSGIFQKSTLRKSEICEKSQKYWVLCMLSSKCTVQVMYTSPWIPIETEQYAWSHESVHWCLPSSPLWTE